MLKLLRTILIGSILLPSMIAFAGADLAKQLMPDAALVGEGTRTVFFTTVYDAKLFAPKGHFDFRKPYLLTMHYHREVERQKILDKTFETMKESGFTDAKLMHEWKALMAKFMPSVKEGDVLTQYRNEQEHTVFYFNGKEIGKIEDPKFTKNYFGIWFSDNTPLQSLRSELLNLD